MDIASKIREIPDFPQKGILFRDITTLLKEPDAMVEAIDLMTAELKDVDFDYILGPESRGFIFGVPIAYNLRKGFVPVRKAGKLPAEVIRKEYALEYGKAIIEIHKDAVIPGKKYVVVDDLMATGGTSKAIAEVIESMGGEIVKMEFLIELTGLKGRKLLSKYDVSSIIKY
ncbi:MAG: adenine phosphoribosyltransferase [Clostridia bacterium]|jgi:adenine phosphoribosyltransferase|nr:adenine phosphoribosyltransferase [Clostridia bacterium]MCI2000677.1 adenine phosphoribosyltransferase [Clostridia bacterium]MCI2015250.1 adenine phosphoribosyltransferase [Clostridia bacterium]